MLGVNTERHIFPFRVNSLKTNHALKGMVLVSQEYQPEAGY
jgi:hypothetical protein